MEETKTCPFCAETIKVAAVVCRFCGRDLPETTPAAEAPVLITEESEIRAHPSASQHQASDLERGFSVGVGIALALIVVPILLWLLFFGG